MEITLTDSEIETLHSVLSNPKLTGVLINKLREADDRNRKMLAMPQGDKHFCRWLEDEGDRMIFNGPVLRSKARDAFAAWCKQRALDSVGQTKFGQLLSKYRPQMSATRIQRKDLQGLFYTYEIASIHHLIKNERLHFRLDEIKPEEIFKELL